MAQPLPLLLSGPILRRASAREIVIWVATSFDPSAGVEPQIFDLSRVSPLRIATVDTHHIIQGGKNLFVSLLIARPEKGQSFPHGSELGYDLKFADTRQTPVHAVEARLVDFFEDRRFLCYPGSDYPRFRLRSRSEELWVLHGSCRKPHGTGLDALAAADNLLATGVAAQYVSALFLTGDQIYADDVDPVTFNNVRGAVTAVFDQDEHIPTASGSIKQSLLDYGAKRKDFALKDCKFSTDDGEGHLLGFAEFAAMYLVMWSDALWSTDQPATWPLSGGSAAGILEQRERREKHQQNVSSFRRTLPAVRRALANVPTYMIFDDHDVTDDWNLHQEWYDGVWGVVAGRRVVSNALAAYWLFQAWGNDPDTFDDDFRGRIAEYLQALIDNDGEAGAAGRRFDEFIWKFHGWDFVAPTSYRAVFLDTRTNRVLGKRGTAPILINPDTFDKLQETMKKGGIKHRGQRLVVVSPTPVFGFLAVENVRAFYRDPIGEPELYDLEFWRDHEGGLWRFVRFLFDRIQPKACAIMSGDVHYGFLSQHYIYDSPAWAEDAAEPWKVARGRRKRLVQVTSSPLKNEHDSTWKLAAKAVSGNK